MCVALPSISQLQVLNLASDVLKQVPELIDYESTYKLICDDMNPLNVVLLQEVRMMSPVPSLGVHAHSDLNNFRAVSPQCASAANEFKYF